MGKGQPRTSHICHPTLRFLHKWMGITLFPEMTYELLGKLIVGYFMLWSIKFVYHL